MSNNDAEIVADLASDGPYMVVMGPMREGTVLATDVQPYCATCGVLFDDHDAILVPDNHDLDCVWRRAKEARP